jgi:hypothetical protein
MPRALATIYQMISAVLAPCTVDELAKTHKLDRPSAVRLKPLARTTLARTFSCMRLCTLPCLLFTPSPSLPARACAYALFLGHRQCSSRSRPPHVRILCCFARSRRVAQPSTEGGATPEVVQTLFARGSWRLLLGITEPILTSHGQGPASADGARPEVKHTPETLQMWLYRAVALWNLGQHAAAATELKTFGSFDQVDLCYEGHREEGGDNESSSISRGSMVPFSLRLIRAELPGRLGDHGTALVELHALKHACQTAMARLGAGLAEDGGPAIEGADVTVAVAAWRARLQRVQMGIGNCLLRQHEYELAMEVLAGVDVDGAARGALNSGLARIALLQGDHEFATKRFNAAAADAPESSKHMSGGFLALTQGDYRTASAEFEKAW